MNPQSVLSLPSPRGTCCSVSHHQSEFHLFQKVTERESQSTQLSASVFFHLSHCFCISSMAVVFGFLFCFNWVAFHCVKIPQLICSLPDGRWAVSSFRLVWKSFYKHSCANLFCGLCCHFSWINTQGWKAGSEGRFMTTGCLKRRMVSRSHKRGVEFQDLQILSNNHCSPSF